MDFTKFAVWAGAGVALLFSLGLIIYIVGTLFVFAPINIKESQITGPNQVCPGHELRVDYLTTIKGGPYTIDRTTGIFSWVGNGEDKRPIGGSYFDQPALTSQGNDWVSTQEDVLVPTPLRRLAPTQPGGYYNNLQATVKGKMFGVFPVTQDVSYTGKNLITVLDESDPQCIAERRGDTE